MINKKVLVLTTTFPRWKNDSTPPFVFELERRLTNDFDIFVLAPHHPKAKFKQTMGDIKIYRFPYFFPLKWQRLCYEGGILPNIESSFFAKIQVPFFIFSELFWAYKIVKKERPQLIHAHWTVPQGLIAVMIKKFFKIPVLVTAHAGDVFTKNELIKGLNYLVVKNADFITVNSRATKEALLGFNKNPPLMAIIPMGVDTDKFRPIQKEKIKRLKNKMDLRDKKIILFVGRLAEKKGVSYLIKAMPGVLKEIPNAHLVIIGSGSEEKRLKGLTKKLGLEEKISFLGKIPNEELPQYYNLSDVFVAPSIQAKKGDTEGLGVVLLEAIACGTPVIGTNIGGISDIIKNNQTGLLVEQKNSEQLGEAVIKLLENKKIRKQLIKNAQKHIKDIFSWEVVSEKFKKIYKDLI